MLQKNFIFVTPSVLLFVSNVTVKFIIILHID